MKISCIIPAFNESLTIGNVIRKVKTVMSIDEIIVVDDGSTDDTFSRATKQGVITLRHGNNKGKGAAIKTGIAHASGDIIVFIDADIMRLNVKKVSQMISLLKSGKADVVIGTYTFNCFQTFTETVYKPLMGLLFPEVISKIDRGHLSGERALRRSILRKLHLRDGFDLETMMNIELTFMRPAPKISFVDMGDIRLRPKGYQKRMEVIPRAIIEESKRYGRVHRLKDSSFGNCAWLLHDSVRGL